MAVFGLGKAPQTYNIKGFPKNFQNIGNNRVSILKKSKVKNSDISQKDVDFTRFSSYKDSTQIAYNALTDLHKVKSILVSIKEGAVSVFQKYGEFPNFYENSSENEKLLSKIKKVHEILENTRYNNEKLFKGSFNYHLNFDKENITVLSRGQVNENNYNIEKAESAEYSQYLSDEITQTKLNKQLKDIFDIKETGAFRIDINSESFIIPYNPDDNLQILKTRIREKTFDKIVPFINEKNQFVLRAEESGENHVLNLKNLYPEKNNLINEMNLKYEKGKNSLLIIDGKQYQDSANIFKGILEDNPNIDFYISKEQFDEKILETDDNRINTTSYTPDMYYFNEISLTSLNIPAELTETFNSSYPLKIIKSSENAIDLIDSEINRFEIQIEDTQHLLNETKSMFEKMKSTKTEKSSIKKVYDFRKLYNAAKELLK